VTRRLWAVFLAALVVVAGGGFFALSAAGVFNRTKPTAAPTPSAPTPQPSVTPKPSTTPVTTTTTTPPAAQAHPSTPRPTTRPSTQTPSHPTRRYVFPVGACRADASQSHHDYPASDIFAHVGCLFVAPVDGRVDEVTRVDSWDPKTNRGADRGGLSVSVVGADGVRYYGSHLSAIQPGIAPGVQVRAGQILGRTGKTGSAQGTPPHLHFGISWPTGPNMWWIRRGAVAPQQFLNSWHHGGQLSPVATVAAIHRAYGADHGCRSYC
jgi:murein DD-endopeptidase MepM/ murein hydrolase activator NlpD